MADLSSLDSLDLHPRTLQRNIFSGLCCASDQEISDGLSFYPGAHGLCRLFSSISGVPVHRVAGIYAALSPMNGWLSNVSNVLDILRLGEKATVNTTKINKSKALRMLQGEEPETVLGGRKVSSFYRGIAHPDQLDHIPVDRHLLNLALGIKETENIRLRSIASSTDIYERVYQAYLRLGQRERLGNRLASIAWFVQRRIGREQVPMYSPLAPVCCNSPMWSQGKRWLKCPVCKSMKLRSTTERRFTASISPEYDIALPDKVKFWPSKKGRVLLRGKELNPNWLNSAGWQYLARYVVQSETNEKLRKDEHVHHSDGRQINCKRDNLEVWLEERHGQYHGKRQLLYMLRDQLGRWARSEVPKFDVQLAEIGEVPF